MKNFRYRSHISTTIIDGSYIKNFPQSVQKQRNEEKGKGTRAAFALTFSQKSAKNTGLRPMELSLPFKCTVPKMSILVMKYFTGAIFLFILVVFHIFLPFHSPKIREETLHKVKFSTKDNFSKHEQIRTADLFTFT